MDSYAWPLALPRLGWADSAGWADRLAGAFIRFAAEGKFYPLFSFLFGFGLAIQMARAEARGAPFVCLYTRRLLVLLAIGMAHALLLWYGDILVSYAILGFPLLALRHRRPRTLLVWTAACWLLPAALDVALLAAMRGSLTAEARAMLERAAAAGTAEDPASIARSIETYALGSFAQIFWQRVADLKALYLGSVFSIPTVFAMFVLGLWAGRRRIFDDLSASGPLLARVLAWGLLIGGAGNLVYVLAHDLPGGGLAADLAGGGVHALTAPVLTCGYIAAIARLMTAPAWRGWLRPLEAVGRMALTNYLAQSLICTTMFYSYGLGLYGRIGLAQGVALALVIYGVQVAWSTWWMRRFRFGPVEWVWRALTYGRRP